MMTPDAYKAWFDAGQTRVQFELGATQIHRLRPTALTGPVPWQLKWAVIFADGFYAQVTETLEYSRSARANVRESFLFHYGKMPAKVDYYGFPIYQKSGSQTLIRVDNHQPFGPHLHYEGNDHIPQEKVIGFCINEYDLFRFMESVAEHRRTKKQFSEILGFKVQP